MRKRTWKNFAGLISCAIAVSLMASCAHTTPEDEALANKATDELYLKGKHTPAEWATDKLNSHLAWVYKRILYGKYKRGDEEALNTARNYMKELFSDIDKGFNWPVKEQQKFDLPYAYKKPALDGTLEGDGWNGALTFHGEYPPGSLKKNDFPTVWKICWDEEFIYFGARFQDAGIKSIDYDPANKKSPWDGDALEIFVLPDRRLKAYWEVIVNPDNKVVDWLHLNNSDGYWVIGTDDKIHGLKTATKITKDGFLVEVAIPFRELPGYMRGNLPHAGESINLVMVRMNDGQKSTLVPLLYDGHNIFGYPEFTLKK